MTDRDNVSEAFAALSKGRNSQIVITPVEKLRMVLKTIPSGCILYLDITSLDPAEQTKTIKNLAKNKQIIFGIIDPDNTCADPASFFHEGAADYISGPILKKGVDVQRIKRVFAFRTPETPEELPDIKQFPNLKSSGSNWDNIQSGKEYTFCLMFVEMDNIADMKKTMDAKLLSIISDRFRNLIERNISAIGGKLWMWEDFRGLVLFPFDGSSCHALLLAFRLILNNRIYQQEDLRFNTALSYRIVLHIGNTVYRERGDTGTIISDTLNTIFHIGQYFARAGTLSITGEAAQFIPRGLEDYFKPRGDFEGKSIIQMRNLE